MKKKSITFIKVFVPLLFAPIIAFGQATTKNQVAISKIDKSINHLKQDYRFYEVKNHIREIQKHYPNSNQTQNVLAEWAGL